MKDSMRLSEKERFLLEMTGAALSGERYDGLADRAGLFDAELFQTAKKHVIVPLFYDIAGRILPETNDCLEQIQRDTDRIVLQNYHLLLETARMVSLLEEAGIKTVVLKGMAAASFYPVPEYRKSGDIDLLLTEPGKLKEAIDLTKRYGYVVSASQHALHHVVMESKSGMELELHTMIAEPFDNGRINHFLDSILPDIGRHVVQKQIVGFALPILDDDYQAYELLLHMLQHFLREGFGLKLLCDWTLYWNDFAKRNPTKRPARYLELIEESRVAGFSRMVSACCHYFLGMNPEAFRILAGDDNKNAVSMEDAESFLAEVLKSGDFGTGEKGRMVMLRDSSFFSYLREFHHQMHLNFPKAGKLILIWPFLWIFTLVRFLRNNRTLRRISSREIFQNARKRSSLMKKIDLWK